MKKSAIVISFLILGIFFALPVSASAETKAGIKPGSFFYFFDIAFEKVGLFFTFNPENKAKKALEYADERLAEIQAIEEEKNPDAIKTAITNYESNVALATEKSKEVKDKGQAENLLTLIADNNSKNQEVLAEILNKVPDEAKEAITKAIEVSKKGQEEAMKQVAELKGEVEQLKQEVAELKAKSEAETAKAETERLSAEARERAAAELEKQKAEKVKTEAKAIQDEAERQRLQAENAALKAANEAAANTQKQAEINKSIYCNGKYWSQCPVEQEFVCPSSGNAYCSKQSSSSDLNRAANNKAGLINLQNMDIAEQKKLLENSTNEVARTNNILNQLTGFSGQITDVVRNLTIAHRNLFMGYQKVDASMIQYGENLRRKIENIDVAGFTDEKSVAELKDQINNNISQTSQEIYERQASKATYDDSIRSYISILNLTF